MYEQGLTFEPGVTRDLLAHCEAYTITKLVIACETPESYHSHVNAQAVYILAGAGIFRLGEDRLSLSAGNCVQIPPNTIHGFCCVSESVQMLEFFVPSRPDIAQYHQRKDGQVSGSKSEGMEDPK